MPRFLVVTRWTMRALFVAWAVFSFFFFSPEEQWAARAGLFAPALVPLVVSEYLFLRAREKRSFRAAVQSLGLVEQWQLIGQRVTGTYRGHELDLRTEASNELGKGTCLELRVPDLEGLALGPSRIRRRLKRAAGEGASERPFEGAMLFATDWWARALVALPLRQKLLGFCRNRGPNGSAAVLGPRVVRAFYGRLQTLDELRTFVDQAADVADALRAVRR